MLAFPDTTADIERLFERQIALNRVTVCPIFPPLYGRFVTAFIGILPRPIDFHSLIQSGVPAPN
jgi:hypothetical protein